MRKLIMNSAMTAMILGGITAFAFKAPAPKLTDKLYTPVSLSEDPSGWKDITGLTLDASENPAPETYQCASSSSTCSAIFDHVPTSPGDVPTGTIEEGTFVPN